MNKIFPKEIIENTVQTHEFTHRTKSKVIYAILLVGVVSALIALPFVKVKIYTSARGIIKPDRERVSLSSMYSGKVVYLNMDNNQKVKKGDTLLIINNKTIDDKIKLVEYQAEKQNSYLKDLNYLTKVKRLQFSKIHSPKYQQDVLQYKEKLNELATRLEKVKVDFNRNKKLFKKGVISKVEFETTKFDYDLAVNSMYQYKKQQINRWQTSLSELENRTEELKNNKFQLEEDKKKYVVTAPISGVLLGVKGIENGSVVTTGIALAEISPNTNLLVECYLPPADVGLLKLNNNVNFQIDAFNYNQWGLATGNTIEIGNDIEFINNQPIFKVRCNLENKFLQLKNGHKGSLIKGLTLNARFELAERTLFDLLYDKVDDWMNPSMNEIAKN